MIVKSLLQTCSSEWFALPWRMIRVLFGHRLPSLPFIAVRSEIAGHQPMCSLAGLDEQIDDFLPLPIVNRHFESLLARGRTDKSDCKAAADIRLRFWLLRCFQDFEKLSGLGGRLET
jgi:hypothetical protein